MIASLQVGAFTSPKIELEQYATTPDLAARILLLAAGHGDIQGKNVVDLGCGTCMLSIAAVCCGAGSVLGVDTDPDAIADAQTNLAALEMDEDVDLLMSDVTRFASACERLPRSITSAPEAAAACSPSAAASSAGAHTPSTAAASKPAELSSGSAHLPVDTVIMNPPFGTRTAGADAAFIVAAAALRPRAIYSLHKTSTRDFLVAKAASVGYKAVAAAEMAFDLPKTYVFHKQASGTVAVDLLRMTPIVDAPAAE
jgi:predicted RNA methylase